MVTNRQGEIFVKDDTQIIKFKEDGTFIHNIGKGILERPYGKEGEACFLIRA